MKNVLKISACFLLGATTMPAFSESQTSFGIENTAPSSSLNYWTAEKLQHAKEMTIPSVTPGAIRALPANNLPNAPSDSGDGSLPEENTEISPLPLYYPESLELITQDSKTSQFNRGDLKFDFTSSRLVPLTADLEYPYRTIGKLFFTIPNEGDYVCSASVLRHRVVLTAGHCVHAGSNGSAGFYTNFLFVPAYRDGIAPLKSWTWTYATTTSTWATGKGNVPNAADYAMIEISDQSINGTSKRIGTVTGYLGYQTQALHPNHAHLLGYPCNFDSCQKMHQVSAQSARLTSPNNAEYGSDMRGGSSGGPWVQNFGNPSIGQTGGLNPGVNRIVGVTSYGYVANEYKAQGSSILDSRFIDLLNTICARKVDNCA